MERCLDCNYARKACAGKPYILCSYWTNNRNVQLMFESGLVEVFTGWGYWGQRPDYEFNGNETTDSHIVTNQCIIVHEDDNCGKFTT